MNEAILTGESMPTDKYTHALGEGVPVAERKNLVYMGTVITYGLVAAVVVMLVFLGLLLRLGFLAILMSVGIFLIFNCAQAKVSLEEARNIAFCFMVAFEWFRAFNARCDEHALFKSGIIRNRWLVISISVAIVLQLAVVYLPFLRVAFGTVPLSICQGGYCRLSRWQPVCY